MGLILSFERPDRPSLRAPRARDEALGQILLFTGVRYERVEEPPAPRKGPKGRTPSRRRGG